VGHDVWFVQRGGVQHSVHVVHAGSHKAAVCDRSHVVRERRLLDVESHRMMTLERQGPHQGLSEMSGASSNQDVHDSAKCRRASRKCTQ
jgi:hypothetical protein